MRAFSAASATIFSASARASATSCSASALVVSASLVASLTSRATCSFAVRVRCSLADSAPASASRRRPPWPPRAPCPPRPAPRAAAPRPRCIRCSAARLELSGLPAGLRRTPRRWSVRSCSAWSVASWACVDAAFSSRSASVRARSSSCSASARADSASAVSRWRASAATRSASARAAARACSASARDSSSSLRACASVRARSCSAQATFSLTCDSTFCRRSASSWSSCWRRVTASWCSSACSRAGLLGVLLQDPLGLRARLAELALGVLRAAGRPASGRCAAAVRPGTRGRRRRRRAGTRGCDAPRAAWRAAPRPGSRGPRRAGPPFPARSSAAPSRLRTERGGRRQPPVPAPGVRSPALRGPIRPWSQACRTSSVHPLNGAPGEWCQINDGAWAAAPTLAPRNPDPGWSCRRTAGPVAPCSGDRAQPYRPRCTGSVLR